MILGQKNKLIELKPSDVSLYQEFTIEDVLSDRDSVSLVLKSKTQNYIFKLNQINSSRVELNFKCKLSDKVKLVNKKINLYTDDVLVDEKVYKTVRIKIELKNLI